MDHGKTDLDQTVDKNLKSTKNCSGDMLTRKLILKMAQQVRFKAYAYDKN